MTEYFYDKYSKITEIKAVPAGAYGDYFAPGINTSTDRFSHGGVIYESYFRGAYTNYTNKKIEVASGIYRYEFELTDPKLSPYPFNFHDENQIVAGETVYDNGHYWGWAVGSIVKGYVSFFDPKSGDIYMQVTDIIYHGTSGVGVHETINYDTVYSRGGFIETLVRNETYPVNGAKNGYWWIRKGKYTIPAPTIIIPGNSFEVNKKDGDDMPYLVFELTPRETNDSNLYHVRARLGFRSDFADYEVYLESKEDVNNWEYYDGSTWQSFPPCGVSANTKVRIKPDVESFEFGFYYWDCTAYNSQWGYGVSSKHRVIIVLDETDGVYVLVVNGIQYNAINLKISESSNGETGSINIVLSNHNI